MEIQASKQKDTLVLSLDGRLDTFGSKELQAFLGVEVTEETTCVVFDLEKVAYVSSAALRVFLIQHKESKKKGGVIALCCLGEYCRNVFDMAGFSQQIPLFNAKKDAEDFCLNIVHEKEVLEKWNELESFEMNVGNLRVIPYTDEKGVIHLLGDVKEVLYSRITQKHMSSKRFCKTEYSIGLGGLGDDFDDYFQIMGEMMTIGGVMVWLPTDGHDTPDFLAPKKDTGGVTIRTGFNASIAGKFNELLFFTAEEKTGVTIDQLYRAIFDLAKSRRKDYQGIVGAAIYADMPAVLGSGVMKSPIEELAPVNGEMIVSPENMKEWFDSDKEPRYQNVTGLICGLGVDLTEDLSSYDENKLNAMFYIHPDNIGGKDKLLHNHGVIFEKLEMPEKMVNMEKEINRVVEAGEFIDMRHLLDNCTISQALIGVSYIQEIVEDPAGE